MNDKIPEGLPEEFYELHAQLKAKEADIEKRLAAIEASLHEKQIKADELTRQYFEYIEKDKLTGAVHAVGGNDLCQSVLMDCYVNEPEVASMIVLDVTQKDATGSLNSKATDSILAHVGKDFDLDMPDDGVKLRLSRTALAWALPFRDEAATDHMIDQVKASLTTWSAINGGFAVRPQMGWTTFHGEELNSLSLFELMVKKAQASLTPVVLP